MRDDFVAELAQARGDHRAAELLRAAQRWRMHAEPDELDPEEQAHRIWLLRKELDRVEDEADAAAERLAETNRELTFCRRALNELGPDAAAKIRELAEREMVSPRPTRSIVTTPPL